MSTVPGYTKVQRVLFDKNMILAKVLRVNISKGFNLINQVLVSSKLIN